jgi:hypothetical protein
MSNPRNDNERFPNRWESTTFELERHGLRYTVAGSLKSSSRTINRAARAIPTLATR